MKLVSSRDFYIFSKESLSNILKPSFFKISFSAVISVCSHIIFKMKLCVFFVAIDLLTLAVGIFCDETESEDPQTCLCLGPNYNYYECQCQQLYEEDQWNLSLSEKHKIYEYATQPSHSVMRASTRDEILDDIKRNVVKPESSRDSSGHLSDFNGLNFNNYLKELRSRKPDEFSKLMNEISTERKNKRHRESFPN